MKRFTRTKVLAMIAQHFSLAHAIAPYLLRDLLLWRHNICDRWRQRWGGSTTSREWGGIHWERSSIPGGIAIKWVWLGFHEFIVLISSIITHGDIPDGGGCARQRRSGCRWHTLFSVRVVSLFIEIRSYFTTTEKVICSISKLPSVVVFEPLQMTHCK
jgi:hypothetical protein